MFPHYRKGIKSEAPLLWFFLPLPRRASKILSWQLDRGGRFHKIQPLSRSEMLGRESEFRGHTAFRGTPIRAARLPEKLFVRTPGATRKFDCCWLLAGPFLYVERQRTRGENSFPCSNL